MMLVTKNSLGFVSEHTNNRPVNMSKVEYIYRDLYKGRYNINFKLGFDREVTWSFRCEDERDRVLKELMEI